jgi:hypothetical protein
MRGKQHSEVTARRPGLTGKQLEHAFEGSACREMGSEATGLSEDKKESDRSGGSKNLGDGQGLEKSGDNCVRHSW